MVRIPAEPSRHRVAVWRELRRTGAIPLGPTTINCTGTLFPADPNSCSDYDQFYKYNGHGQWKLLEGWSNS